MNLAQSLEIKTKFASSYLVDVLRENLKKHQAEYAEARKAYEQKVSDLLLDITNKAVELRNKKTFDDRKDLNKVFSELNQLQKPIDATKMYEEYIKLFMMSTEPEIEMGLDDANAVINDQWTWAVSAKAANLFYTSK